MTTGSTKIVRTMCPMNCHPTFCGMLVDVQGGKVKTVSGVKHNPDSQGFLCVRGRSTNEIFGNPRRLLYPQIRDDRRSNTWSRVSWDQALDFIVKRMRVVGPEAVGLWAGHGGFTPLLKPIVDGRIRAITWKNDDGGFDKLGIIPSARGIQFVKRDGEGKLAGLFVAYACTATMFGGCRKWFACPGCGRPARVLYGVNSLQCRRCRGLKYASQSEASHWRAQRKALGIRGRLGASGDALDGPFPPKSPKMRWATYERLRAVDAALREQWVLGVAGDLGRLHSRE